VIGFETKVKNLKNNRKKIWKEENKDVIFAPRNG
jgi:hypothetical protein